MLPFRRAFGEEGGGLCYAGVTPAKDKLHMSYARQRRLYGALQQNLPSRFLNEIPRQFFQPAGCGSDDFEAADPQVDDEVVIDFDMNEKKRRILFD